VILGNTEQLISVDSKHRLVGGDHVLSLLKSEADPFERSFGSADEFDDRIDFWIGDGLDGIASEDRLSWKIWGNFSIARWISHDDPGDLDRPPSASCTFVTRRAQQFSHCPSDGPQSQ